MNESKQKTEPMKLIWKEPVRLKHVRFHSGVQIRGKVYMSLDATSQASQNIELWGMPNGEALVKIDVPKIGNAAETETEVVRVGAGMIHAKYEA